MEVVNELRETIPVFVKAMEDAALSSRQISELKQDLMVEKAKTKLFIADNDALAVSNKRLLGLVNTQTEVVVSAKALRQRVLEKEVQEKLLKQTICSLEKKCDDLEADAIELKKSCQIDLDKKEMDLSKAQSMLHVAREEKKEIDDKLKILHENMSQINVDVEKRIADIKQRHESGLEKLTVQANERDPKEKFLRRQVTSLKKEIASWKEKNEKLQSNVDSLKRQLQQLQERPAKKRR